MRRPFLRPRLSSLLHAILFVFFATALFLFLPALRSYLSTEGPIDEAREDLTQFLKLQRFAYLVERRNLTILGLDERGSSDKLRDVDGEITGLLATLYRIAEEEEDIEAGEMESIAALEALDGRLRRETEKLIDLAREPGHDARLEAARAIWEEQRKEVSSVLARAQLREGDAVGESLDSLLSASGHFAFVPFLSLEEKTDALRTTTAAAREATRFLFHFERLVGGYAAAALWGMDRASVDLEAGLAGSMLTSWRLHAESHPEPARIPLDEVETAYRRFREAGDALFALRDPEERLAALRDELVPLAESDLPQLMEASVSAYEKRLSEILDEIERQFELAGRMILLITAALAALMLLGPWLLSRWVIQPVSALSEASRALGQGELTSRVRVRGSREIAELMERFNQTAVDLAELQEKLKRQERLAMLGELSGSIGHEIRNPLSAMKSSIFFLRRRRDKAIDAKAEEHLERIDRQIRRADRIITELLDYARNPVTSPRSIELHEILDEVLTDTQLPPEVRVERGDRDGSARAFADPEQVGRIFENLVKNAVQAMPEGGALKLAFDSRGAEVVASVSDTGLGIPKEHLAKIFEPLVTQKTKGLGLGLPVARRYAELNGGRIECESEEGRGSLFRLILPAAKTEERS